MNVRVRVWLAAVAWGCVMFIGMALGACVSTDLPTIEGSSSGGPTCSGLTLCGSQCINTKTNPDNCGTCGNACGKDNLCSDGMCVSECKGGTEVCAGACIDTQNDPANCGTCGIKCAAEELCSGGKCGVGCSGGTVECGSKCVDTMVDTKHCGMCDKVCPTGQACAAGVCDTVCSGGSTKCGDKCVDIKLDPAHCGKCDNACPMGETCSAGMCSLDCVGGSTKCGTTCVDVMLDTKHCGMCDNACPMEQLCSMGKCEVKCFGGTTDCGGKCVDTMTNLSHCGMCNQTCGSSCTAGKCAGGFPGSKLIDGTDSALIDTWVGSNGKTWTLCYRKTTDGASATTFHTKCNGKGPTITVMQLSTGKKIGGYGPQSWTQRHGRLAQGQQGVLVLADEQIQARLRWQLLQRLQLPVPAVHPQHLRSELGWRS